MSVKRTSGAGRLRVAVSGASGFVGRHVVDALVRRDVEVVALTRRPDHMAGRVRMVGLDIASVPADAYDRLGRPDVLLHLAWDGLPNYRSPRHFETELPRQYAFLKTLVESGLPSVLAVGTCFEYGLQYGALSEVHDPRPVTPYGYAKDALRRQLEFLRVNTPFALTWARLFYMHGEGQPANSLLPSLRAAAEHGQRTFDMSGGEQLRDYLPVTDVADRLVELLLHCPDSGVVNVCSGRPVSVRNLVEQWIADNGWDIVPNLGAYPYADYEPMAFWGDPAKFANLTRSAAGLPGNEQGASR